MNATIPVKILVESAVELNQSEQSSLKAAFSKHYSHIDFMWQVDPSLIGGLKITINDQVIDLSLDYRLNLLSQELLTHVS